MKSGLCVRSHTHSLDQGRVTRAHPTHVHLGVALLHHAPWIKLCYSYRRRAGERRRSRWRLGCHRWFVFHFRYYYTQVVFPSYDFFPGWRATNGNSKKAIKITKDEYLSSYLVALGSCGGRWVALNYFEKGPSLGGGLLAGGRSFFRSYLQPYFDLHVSKSSKRNL